MLTFLLFASLILLQFGIGYRMIHERSTLANAGSLNLLLFAAFITNLFLVSYFTLVLFDPNADALLELLWIPVFSILEITILAIHFLNGTINQLLKRTETWITTFRC